MAAAFAVWAAGVVATMSVVFGSAPAMAVDPYDPPAEEIERTEISDDWRTVETENGWALPIDQLGWGAALVASNDDATFDLSVPFAPRHRVDSIEFTASLASDIPEGHVIVSLDGDELSTTLLESDEPVPVRVALPRTATAGSTVSIRIHPHHPDCPVGASSSIGRLSTPTFFFRSAPVAALSSSGALLTPEVVSGVQFIVDETRSSAVEQSVLTASASIARRFPGEQRFGAIAADTDLDPAPPFVVRVRIAERDNAAILGDSENGRFVLTGRSDELVAQATGLVDALTTLDEIDQVTVSDVVAQSEDWPHQRPIETVTSRLRVAGAHHLELPILLEQTDFGQPVTSYRIRLGGVASPTRSADATGTQLGLWVGDEILEVLELDENGRFDLETTIAGDRVDRAIVMKLVLDLQIEGCPAGDSLGIQLDRGSWIEADFGQGVEPGFGRIPQAFGQGMAVDPGSTVSHLSTAADAVGLLQDTTNWSLNPVVTERSQIAAAGPAVVVGADIELLDLLGAPVNGPSGRIDTGQATIAATSDVDSRTPVMQAFVSLDGSDVLSIDAVAENAGFGLPDTLSVHRFRQIRGTVVQLNESGLIEVAGITLERSANHDEVALAPLASGTGDGHLNSSANGMARRELFALGLAATMLVAGVVMFGRRSVRAAARANTISR